jgi:hypothetical protein
VGDHRHSFRKNKLVAERLLLAEDTELFVARTKSEEVAKQFSR